MVTRATDGMATGSGRRTWILIGALIVVALWAQPWASRKRPVPTPAPAPAVAVAATPSTFSPPPAASAGSGWGRDPFDPTPATSGAEKTGR
jgi:hypothetical protein